MPQLLSVRQGRREVGQVAVNSISEADLCAALRSLLGRPTLQAAKDVVLRRVGSFVYLKSGRNWFRKQRSKTPTKKSTPKKRKKTKNTPPWEKFHTELKKAMGGLGTRDLARMENDFRQREEEIKRLNSAITEALKNREALKKRLENTKSGVHTPDAQTMLRRIADMKDVASVEVSKGQMTVCTKDLVARLTTNHGSRWKIGRVEITIPIEAFSHNPNIFAYPRFRNLSHPRAYRAHPQVAGQGVQGCLGEIGNQVEELLERKLLPELVSVLITYLKSINGDEWYPTRLEDEGWEEVRGRSRRATKSRAEKASDDEDEDEDDDY